MVHAILIDKWCDYLHIGDEEESRYDRFLVWLMELMFILLGRAAKDEKVATDGKGNKKDVGGHINVQLLIYL